MMGEIYCTLYICMKMSYCGPEEMAQQLTAFTALAEEELGLGPSPNMLALATPVPGNLQLSSGLGRAPTCICFT